MGLCAIFGEVPVFLGFSQKKKIMIRELFLMNLVNKNKATHEAESSKKLNPSSKQLQSTQLPNNFCIGQWLVTLYKTNDPNKYPTYSIPLLRNFFLAKLGPICTGTADSRIHDPPFSETGSWKLEVGSWI